MATKFTYDTTNKHFVLNTGVTSLDAKTEFYSAAKYDWLTQEPLRRFRFPLDSIGGQDIGGGAAISPYYSLKYGWRVLMAPEDQSISVYGNIITAEGDIPFIDDPGMYHHVVQYQVSANRLTTGGSPLTAQQVWDYQGTGDSLTAEEKMKVFAAVLAGKAIVTGTNIKFRNPEDTTDVVDATFTEFGDRTTVTITLP